MTIRSALRSALSYGVRNALDSSSIVAGASPQTVELTSGTRQLVFDALSDDIVIRWITADQVEQVGPYLLDVELEAANYRQVIAVPADATAFSMMRGPGATNNVTLSYTETTQASNTMRGGDLVTDIDTFLMSVQAVTAAQGSVTPVQHAGRLRDGWFSRNKSPNAADITGMTEGGTALISATTTDVEGLDAATITLMNDADGNEISEVWSSGWTTTSRGLLVVAVKAVDAAGKGKITRLFAEAVTPAGSSTTSIEIELTESWEYYYIDKTFQTGDASGMKWGFVHTTLGNTDAETFYVAAAMLEDVTGFTTIMPSPYENDTLDHWSEYHPAASLVDMSAYMTVVIGGTSEVGKVFKAVPHALGTVDSKRYVHMTGSPNSGARAGAGA